jgi:hypothetical protein
VEEGATARAAGRRTASVVARRTPFVTEAAPLQRLLQSDTLRPGAV